LSGSPASEGAVCETRLCGSVLFKRIFVLFLYLALNAFDHTQLIAVASGADNYNGDYNGDYDDLQAVNPLPIRIYASNKEEFSGKLWVNNTIVTVEMAHRMYPQYIKEIDKVIEQAKENYAKKQAGKIVTVVFSG
ncbi:MAG: hypothetical protein LBT46_02460, partial [Planctomycetaceae bacterium]|nr:hypothetical protein [Planctomycetaceae bacterium]